MPFDTWDALGKLRAFQEQDLLSSSLERYNASVYSLEGGFRLAAVAGTVVEPGAVMAWWNAIPESILDDIRAYQPHAILILAYFSILLVSIEKNFWYPRGWGKRLLEEVETRLLGQPKFAEQLQWPRNAMSELYNPV